MTGIMDHITRRETISQTWTEIFAAISPDLLQQPSDGSVNFKLGSALYRKLHPDSQRTVEVHHDRFQTIKVQLLALGLINVLYTPTTKGDMALFWTLTPRGQGLMLQLRAVKAAPKNPA
jgi:hypothetical protein